MSGRYNLRNRNTDPDSMPGEFNPLNSKSTSPAVDNGVMPHEPSLSEETDLAQATPSTKGVSFGSISSENITNVKSFIKHGKNIMDIGTDYDNDLATDENTPVNKEHQADDSLTPEHIETIDLAAASMTPDESELLRRRTKLINTSETGTKERTSHKDKDKGKGADPRNWGNIEIPEQELNVKNQTKELKKYKASYKNRQYNEPNDNLNSLKTKEHQRKNNKYRSSSTPLSADLKKNIKRILTDENKKKTTNKVNKQGDKRGSLDHNLRPINQVDPKSYLGRAFKALDSYDELSESSSHENSNDSTSSLSDNSSTEGDDGPSENGNNSEDSNDSSSKDSSSDSPSESSPSSSDNEFSYTDNTDSDSTDIHNPQHRQNNHKKKERKSKSKKSLLKPIPPEKYDGTANVQEFHKFMRQAKEYITDGRVPKHRQVSLLSNFLIGRAYTFYTREVVLRPEKWNLSTFFSDLFNYCFPVNFRTIQRQKLESCRQHGRSVRDFASHLNELFMTVGYTDKRERVNKLWFGLRPDIQRALWKDKLNPDTSSYESVLYAAELNEIANSVMQENRRDSQYKRGHNNREHEHFSNYRRSRKGDHGNEFNPESRKRFRKNSTEFYGRRTNEIPNFNSNKHRRERHDNRDYKPRGYKFKKEIRQRKKLSKEEMERYRANQQCFECGEVGHMARHCPKKNNVSSSSGTGRPPSAVHNIELSTIQEMERLKNLADTTEGLDEIEFNMISFEGFGLSDDDDSESFTGRTSNPDPYTENTTSSNTEGDNYSDMPSLKTISNSSDEYESIDDDEYYERKPATNTHDDENEGPTKHDSSNNNPTIETHTLNPRELRQLEVLNFHARIDKWIAGLEDIACCDYKNISKEERNIASVYNNLAYDMEQEMIRPITKQGRMLIRTRIGDYGRMRLLVSLSYHAPYTPKETEHPGGVHSRLRFEVLDSPHDYYVICDYLYGTELRFPKRLTTFWCAFSLAKFYARELAQYLGISLDHKTLNSMYNKSLLIPWGRAERHSALWLLNSCYELVHGKPNEFTWDRKPRFDICHRLRKRESIPESHVIIDHHTGKVMGINHHLLTNRNFDLVNWVYKQLNKETKNKDIPEDPDATLLDIRSLFQYPQTQRKASVIIEKLSYENIAHKRIEELEFFGQQVEMGTYPAIQQNSAGRRDAIRSVPRPLVVVVNVNGHPARALIDSGSLGDFMSTSLAQQLSVQKMELTAPVNVQMAVQGSRTKINYGTKVRISYQNVDEERYFDIINLSNYDLVLGTPFLYQHKVTLSIEPATVIIGSKNSLPLKGTRVTKLASRAATILEDNLEKLRGELKQYAQKLCLDTSKTPLPPLRDINHEIPLIDPSKQYHWRPSRCPEPLRHLWNAKRDAYIRSGRWIMKPVPNAVPMLLIPKTRKPGEPPKLRTVVDLRERNRNTQKMSSPLPEIDGILRRVASARYRSSIDLADAYEQVRVKPEHVERTAMTTPDGTMISQVMQQGDCNASATFQLVMTRIFAPYIGDFLEVYLDDLIIYSKSLEEHVKHIRIVIDILEREKFYLSEKKLHFLEKQLSILGRIVSDEGIRMDPDKVDALTKWKTPTSRDLLRGFLGSAGYLADDIDRVRIPMGILHELTGDTVPFRWEFTHQRAFQDVKRLAVQCKDHHRKPLKYEDNAPPINVVTDGCTTGIAGVVSQGHNWKTAKVAAFFSAKLNPAQQNYPVHEIELLAGVETMMRHRDLLHGAKFRWYTDHKGLIHLLSQKNLSPRQARWMEKLAEFDFEIIYVPGTENILSDALSRMYSNDQRGTVRARTEYTYHDVIDNDQMPSELVTMPVMVGMEGEAEFMAIRRSQTRNLESGVKSSSTGFIPQGRKEGGNSPNQHQYTPTARNAMITRQKAQKQKQQQPRLTQHIRAPPSSKRNWRQMINPKNNDARRAKERKPANGTEIETNKQRSMRKHDKNKNPEVKERLTIRIPARNKATTPMLDNRDPKETIENIDSSNGDEKAREKNSNDVAEKANIRTFTQSQESTEPNNNQHETPINDDVIIPSLIDVINGGYNGGLDLLKELKGKYNQDSLFRKIIENPKAHKNFVVENGVILIRQGGSKLLCIPNLTLQGRNIREIIISEAHSLLAHLGVRKTLNYLRDHVWWKEMASDVATYCETCMTCKRSKPNNHKPYGLLNPLQVPSTPWENIGIDFVGPLPESKDRNASFDTITVIIDRLTGMVHLVPSRQNYNARQVAELIFAEVYRLHGLPKSIVSDRDTLFTSTFWKHLHGLIGTKLHMSSAYHPESDGSTERANRTITQMLRQCITSNQKDWVSKLPAIEFAINSARSEVTGYAPFFLNYGRVPRSFIWNTPEQSEYPGVRVFANKLKNAVMSAHDSILAHRVKETRTANKKRIPSPFKEGDLVYISTKNISFPRNLARKLIPKFIGPYPILRDFRNNSYQIGLSDNLKQRGVHDVFHASLLRIHVPNDDRLFPGRLDNQVWDLGENGQEWAVQRIKSHSGSRKNALFEIQWKSGDVTWLPYHKIDHLTALEQYFEILGISSIDQLEDNRVQVPDEDADEQVLLGAMSLELHWYCNAENDSIRCSGGRELELKQSFESPCTFVSSSHFALYPGFFTNLPPSKLNTMFPRHHDSAHYNLAIINTPLPNIVETRSLTQWKIKVITQDENGVESTSEHPFTPGTFRLFLMFDYAVRTGNPNGWSTPIGYTEFAEAFNMQDIPYKLSTYDYGRKCWDSPGSPINKDIIDLSAFAHVLPPQIDETLIGLGIMNSDGSLNRSAVISACNRLINTPALPVNSNNTLSRRFQPYRETFTRGRGLHPNARGRSHNRSTTTVPRVMTNPGGTPSSSSQQGINDSAGDGDCEMATRNAGSTSS